MSISQRWETRVGTLIYFSNLLLSNETSASASFTHNCEILTKTSKLFFLKPHFISTTNPDLIVKNHNFTSTGWRLLGGLALSGGSCYDSLRVSQYPALSIWTHGHKYPLWSSLLLRGLTVFIWIWKKYWLQSRYSFIIPNSCSLLFPEQSLKGWFISQ